MLWPVVSLSLLMIIVIGKSPLWVRRWTSELVMVPKPHLSCPRPGLPVGREYNLSGSQQVRPDLC